MEYNKIHHKFKFNGTSYGVETLKEVAYDLVKEGALYEKAIGDFLLDWLDDKLIVEVKTSGSTGTPKNIKLQKQHMVNSALATGMYFDLKPEDKIILCLPADYIAGKMMLVRAMVLGLEIDSVAPSLNPLSKVNKKYDFAAMIPLQVANSLAYLQNITKLIIGGASVSNTLKNELQTIETKVYETYGMTETITHVAVRNVNHSKADTPNNFKALANVSFSVDHRDCLIISSPKVSNSKITTNDIVSLVSETEFKWLGRYDNIINSGGVKLIPEQIETKLSSCIIDKRFFVAGISDDKLGEKLVLLIEGEINTVDLLKKITTSKLLDKFEVPKEIHAISKFIETDSGKINRKQNLLLIKN